jgi:hypothetical protein
VGRKCSLSNPQVTTWLVRAFTVLPSIFVASMSPEVRFARVLLLDTW